MIQIVKNRKISFAISSILFLTSLVLIFSIGLKPGIDFTGGSLMELTFKTERPPIDDIKSNLAALNLGEILVQPVEDKGLILKMRYISEEEHQQVLTSLRTAFEGKKDAAPSADKDLVIDAAGSGAKTVEVALEAEPTNRLLENRIETIGPAISSYLRSKAWKAALVVIIAIILFIAYAFRRVSKPIQSWKYGLTAIIALVHDITITMGVFVLLGKYLGVEVNIPFVVALLTILGYSVNDTIVVFDRVRENLIRRGSHDFPETVNLGINQTLVRSFNTSITTLLVLFGLFMFGGESIKYFSLALIVGILLGTYSSLFLASPFLVVWEERLYKNK